jgi:hypothetical protein
VLGFGLHYVGYPIRVKYRDFLDTLTIGEGLYHVLGYLGHIAIYAVMFLYAWAVRKDRKYIFSFTKGKPKRNFIFALLVDVLSCVAVILIGRYIRKKKNKLS